MKELLTPWAGHWREGEYLSFVHFALGQDDIRRQYREATGDGFEPAADPTEMDRQIRSGEAMAYLHRFSDWLAENVFGTPDSVGEPVIKGRAVH